MPTFARRKENIHDLFYSKKRKLSVQQNFQRILAQEAAASTNENRVNNKFPPDEPMVERRTADERMSECDNRNDGQGMADDPFSDSDASFVLARDDSMSSEDDDNQNDFIFDDMFGLEATDDGTTDDGQSLKTTSASRQSANLNGNPQVMMYQDEEEQPPTAEDDIEFTNLEVAELELLMLCDASGARCRFFDDLLTLLHRFHKKRIDITKAKGRASFMATMESKVKCPKPFSKKVKGRDVICFPFFDSLQDLLRSSTFYDIDNLCANKAEQDCFNHFQPTTVANNSEIMSNEWASKTQDQLAADKDFDPDQDYFLALQVYGDKTGTDVNQRYPLEPWMFTLVALRLMARQDPKKWRHLGFIPLQDFAPSNKVSLSPKEKLQQYHNYMLVLLDEVKEVSKAKPMMWVNLGGIWKKKRLRIVLSVVLGNQKSQDFLCGRKAINNGSAGWVHHRCMASAVNSTAVGPDSALHGGCQKPPIQVLNRLNDLALMDVNDNANSGPMALVQQLLPSGSTNQQKEKRLVVQHLCRVKRLSKNILGKSSFIRLHTRQRQMSRDRMVTLDLSATTDWNSMIEAETQTCILCLSKTLLSALWRTNLFNIKSPSFRE
jgi:hypothetical protein